MNFTFQRNPERLLDLCGLSPIRDRRQEKLFMEKAAALEAQDLRPLVLVIGGFLDQILGNSYAVSARSMDNCYYNNALSLIFQHVKVKNCQKTAFFPILKKHSRKKKGPIPLWNEACS